MEAFKIIGGQPLFGEVTISGAKNAALPILMATVLSKTKMQITNVPRLKDIDTTLALLQSIGIKAQWIGANKVEIDAEKIEHSTPSPALAQQMRASVLLLGPLLARTGSAKIALPGGCKIGARPVDLHIKGLEAMQANITSCDEAITASAPLNGGTFHMETVSVTGTENLMMAATLAKGTTTISNAAKEPEIIDLANCLRSMGAFIQGDGTDTIMITGVEGLKGTSYRVMPDRIEAGTFLVAGVATQGKVKCLNANPEDLVSVINKIREAGASITSGNNWIEAEMKKRPKSTNISTAPHPGFPTDMQAQFSVLNAIAEGISSTTENIFENRFMHTTELNRMGAKIKVNANTATIEGTTPLQGTTVQSSDLRASASLVLAGLIAEGTTQVEQIYHIDRGYEEIEQKLSSLGANIQRISC